MLSNARTKPPPRAVIKIGSAANRDYANRDYANRDYTKPDYINRDYNESGLP
jgi:hypothetical protein